MDRIQDIGQRILKVLSQSLSMELTDAELKNHSRLDEAFGMDSMAILEFLVALEKEFKVIFPPDDLDYELLRDLPRLQSYLAERVK